MADFRISAGPFLLKSDRQRVLAALIKAPDQLVKEAEGGFSDIGSEIERRIKRRMVPFQASGGSQIAVRTGALRQSVGNRVVSKGKLDDMGVLIYAGSRSVPYARIQEKGGTVRPKKQYLRVPLPGILTSGGDVQGKYEIYNAGGKWVTGGGKDTWISGRAIMVMEGGKPRPIWALVKSVKIKPRLGMGDTIEDYSDGVREHLLNAINRSLRSRK